MYNESSVWHHTMPVLHLVFCPLYHFYTANIIDTLSVGILRLSEVMKFVRDA